MAINTRNCFWFGTEDKADWFATPLQGADSSPSAWGADGTLLNGGGWALNSWGSHKRYTYEWPASSSRETAQRMKSYRDGTYGRGLLYFLEPTIFTTNVLPAHWADPSMSLDNEAPSLVYGVDPTPVATSGGANLGLPITSAHYDLSNVTPRTVPTPDSSVFIPIPTGHTLFLGAFYSSTGTGGVFATPVNGNGTLGTAVKLTEKSNADTDVVTDQFSGDLRGVRLWVGRPDATASTVTIAAMAGRIIETSDLPVYGPWVEQSRNLATNGSFEAGITAAPGATLNNATGTQSSEWSQSGLNSLRITPSSGDANSRYVLSPIDLSTFEAGKTYTVVATLRIDTPQGGSLSSSARRIWAANSTGVAGDVRSPQSPNAPGVYEHRVTFSVPATGVTWATTFLYNGASLGNGDVWWDDVLITEGTYSGSYYDGGSNPSGTLERTRWLGPPNASESITETRTISGNPDKENRLKRGPWVGGQGHSGCRFLGTPSYVTNSPIEGGRIGFAASFVEVGSWVYG